MVKIDPFEVDHWILTRHASAKHSLAHSYCASLSINDIQLYSEGSNDACTSWSPLLSKAMGYGPMQGSEDLRSKISNLYSDKSSEDGDHVIVQYPTYQQLYSVPASVGADVSLWKANDGEGWRLDLDELKQLIKPNTKMIVINNPVNPTGAAISKTTLEAIVRIASERSIIVFCDEVYYPLFHSIEPTDPELPPSILSLGYKNTIATGSLSKTYSLPGLRVGWIASRNSSYIDTCVNARSYALITLSQVDESLGALALSTPIVQNLMKRNITLSRHNLDVVQSFIDKNSSISEWVRPSGGRSVLLGSPNRGVPLMTWISVQGFLTKKVSFLSQGANVLETDLISRVMCVSDLVYRPKTLKLR